MLLHLPQQLSGLPPHQKARKNVDELQYIRASRDYIERRLEYKLDVVAVTPRVKDGSPSIDGVTKRHIVDVHKHCAINKQTLTRIFANREFKLRDD